MSVLVTVSANSLKKIVDATKPVQEFLKKFDVHDFATQDLGTVDEVWPQPCLRVSCHYCRKGQIHMMEISGELACAKN